MLFSSILVMTAMAQPPAAINVEFIVTHDGKPVANAKVTPYLATYDSLKKETVMQAEAALTTDAAGKASYPFPKLGVVKPRVLIAEAPGLFGVVSQFYPKQEPNPGVWQLPLTKLVPHEGRFVDEDGKGISGIALRVTTAVEKPLPNVVSISYVLPEPYAWRATTDAQGRFRFDTVPEGFGLWIGFKTTSHGRCEIRRTTANTGKEIVLPKAAYLRLAYDFEEAKEARAGRVIILGTVSLMENVPMSVMDRSAPNEEGRYGPFLPGNFNFNYEFNEQAIPAAKRWLVRPKSFTLKPGEDKVLAIESKPLAILTGKVVEKTTGKGVEGLRVSIRGLKGYELGTDNPFSEPVTNAEGVFKAYVRGGNSYMLSHFWSDLKPGRNHLQLYLDDPLQPGAAPKLEVKPGETASFPTIELLAR